MAEAIDFLCRGLEQLETRDWRDCWAAAPVSYSDSETGELLEAWVHSRPAAAIECRAFGFSSNHAGRVAIVTFAECAQGQQWLAERHLVRWPASIRIPVSVAQVVWAAGLLDDEDYVHLTPSAVEGLRGSHAPLPAEAGA